MSGVFRSIDPPPPHRPANVYHPAFGGGGGRGRTHSLSGEGVGGQYFNYFAYGGSSHGRKDADRHSFDMVWLI